MLTEINRRLAHTRQATNVRINEALARLPGKSTKPPRAKFFASTSPMPDEAPVITTVSLPIPIPIALIIHSHPNMLRA